MCLKVNKLRGPETRKAFKVALHMQQLEKEESSVDDEWRQIKQGYVEICEKVLGKAKSNRKNWISKKT